MLLFDEVEKAHQDVFNLLLQVLDDGRLTDARGQLADFTNTVIIMTSNIGSDIIVASDPQQFETETGRAQIREALSSQLAGFFRPELLNRVGDTVVFRPLGKPELRAVAELQLKRTESLLSAHGLTLVIEPDALLRLVELGHEPALGARPMARVIVREIQDPIASRIATEGIPSGSVIRVAYRDAVFTFDW